MIDYLNNQYKFYKVTPINLENFVTENFKKLIGKMYRSSEMGNEIIIALEKNKSIESLDLNIYCQSFTLN